MKVENEIKNANNKRNIVSTGVTRSVDELGRITIPKEVRDAKRIFQGTPLQIYVEGDKIIIQNIFCIVNTKLILYEKIKTDDREQLLIEEYKILTIREQRMLKRIQELKKEKQEVDLLIANYVYEKEGQEKVIHYPNLPKDKVFGWNEIKPFGIGEYLLMHSVFYRTKMLKETKISLPEHTFYVDNIFVYYPLPFVKTMYYIDTDFYRYFIGREDQSVNESIMIKRVDQQLFVTKTMIEYGSPIIKQKENKNLQKYQLHYLAMMMTICTILLKIENTEESKRKQKELWAYLKNYDEKLYKKLRWKSLASLVCLPRLIAVPGYKIARKIYKFN